MSRAATGDTVVLRPSNNVYTALVAGATIAVAIGLVIVVMRYNALFDSWPWSS